MRTKLSKSEIKEFYNSEAQEYYDKRENDYIFDIQKRIILDIIGTDTIIGKKAIDIGCGTGLFTVDLLNHGFEVWGIDVSEDMITHANNILSDRNIDNNSVHYSTGDIEDLDFPDNHFDIIISIGALESLSTYDTALKEIYRVLKPGGSVILSLIKKTSQYYLFYKLAEKTVIPLYQKTFKKLMPYKEPEINPQLNLCAPRQLNNTLLKTGFEKLESEHCNFFLYPVHPLFIQFSYFMSKKLEIFSKSKFLGWFGTQYIVKASK